MEIFFIIATFIIAPLWFFVYLPASMAANRDRSMLGWTLLNLIFPIGALVLLAIVGQAYRPEVY